MQINAAGNVPFFSEQRGTKLEVNVMLNHVISKRQNQFDDRCPQISAGIE